MELCTAMDQVSFLEHQSLPGGQGLYVTFDVYACVWFCEVTCNATFEQVAGEITYRPDTLQKVPDRQRVSKIQKILILPVTKVS